MRSVRRWTRPPLANPGSARGRLGGARAGEPCLEIQVIQARHIAEADDAAMTRMEAEMSRAGAGGARRARTGSQAAASGGTGND